MSTLAPSAEMASGIRGAVDMKRSSSVRCHCVGSAATAALLASRGKNASVDAEPAAHSSARMIATGLETSARTSLARRRGSASMGVDTAAPDTKKSAITAAYVITHRTQTIFRVTNDAY